MSESPLPAPNRVACIASVFRMGRLPVRTLSATIWRFTPLKYANTKLFLSGLGSLKAGGRFNFINSFPAVYSSLDEETALAETKHGYSQAGIDDFAAKTRLMAGTGVKLQRVLDLADVTTRALLQIGINDLTGDWKAIQRAGHEALTQTIGREARSAGFEAILTMSARRNDGLNLVIFPDRVLPESTIVMGPLLD